MKKAKEILLDILFFTVGATLYSLGIYSFAVAGDFAPGGIAGVAIIINHFFDFIPIGLCTLIINIPVIAFTFRILGKKFFFKSLISMVIVALVMDCLFPNLPTYSGSPLLAALFAGAFSGIGLSLIYMRNSSTGGTDFLILALKRKYPHMSIGTITILIDGSVIILNGFVFGNIDAVLFGAILTYISTVFIDKIMYAKESRKKISIITSKGCEVGKAISEKMGRGATILDAQGAFRREDSQLVIYICSGRQVSRVKEIVFAVDENALVFVSTSDEVAGRAFS